MHQEDFNVYSFQLSFLGPMLSASGAKRPPGTVPVTLGNEADSSWFPGLSYLWSWRHIHPFTVPQATHGGVPEGSLAPCQGYTQSYTRSGGQSIEKLIRDTFYPERTRRMLVTAFRELLKILYSPQKSSLKIMFQL